MQYTRNETDFSRGTFRVRGDTIDVFPAEHSELAIRIELFDDEVESLQLLDPLTGHIRQKVPRFTIYPSSHYVTPRERVVAAVETHQGGAALAPRRLRQAGQAGGGAAPGAAHALRPRDAAGGGPLQGHRELHAPPVGRHAGRSAAHAGGLHAQGRHHVHRREPRDDRPDRRHVQRRPRAQDQPRRLRLPPAVGARQPAAEVRGVREARCASACSSRPRRPTTRRTHAGAGGRAAGAAHRADRSDGGGAPGHHAGGRRAAGDPRAHRSTATAC